MSHPADPHAAPAVIPFPPKEWEDLKYQDRIAARNIIVLMASIFILGFLGYLGVCVWVSS